MKKEKTLYMPRTANELLELYLVPDPNHNPEYVRLSALREYLDNDIDEDQLLEQYGIVAEETNIEKEAVELDKKLFMQAFKNFAELFAKEQRKLCYHAFWLADAPSLEQEAKAALDVDAPQLADLDIEEHMTDWFLTLDQLQANEIMGDDAPNCETPLQQGFTRRLWWKKLAYHERIEIYVHKKVLGI